jgi:hypothetical protein
MFSSCCAMLPPLTISFLGVLHLALLSTKTSISLLRLSVVNTSLFKSHLFEKLQFIERGPLAFVVLDSFLDSSRFCSYWSASSLSLSIIDLFRDSCSALLTPSFICVSSCTPLSPYHLNDHDARSIFQNMSGIVDHKEPLILGIYGKISLPSL